MTMFEYNSVVHQTELRMCSAQLFIHIWYVQIWYYIPYIMRLETK